MTLPAQKHHARLSIPRYRCTPCRSWPRTVPYALWAVLFGALASPVLAPPTTQPAGDKIEPPVLADAAGVALRVGRWKLLEQGKSFHDIRNAQEVIDNPVYQSWARRPLGTRILRRYDYFGGEVAVLETRKIHQLTESNAEGCKIDEFIVRHNGELDQGSWSRVKARVERHWALIRYRTWDEFHWRVYRAEVELFRPKTPRQSGEAEPATRPAGEGQPQPGEVSGDLPLVMDCIVFEWAQPDERRDDQGLPLANGCYLTRMYNHVDVPGFVLAHESYNGFIGPDGRPTDLVLSSRWRVEAILGPDDPLPSREQLAYPAP